MGLALIVAASARTTQRQFEGPGEYSWGPGLTPPDLQDARPVDGGLYRGKSPAPDEGPALRALADALADRAARGHGTPPEPAPEPPEATP